MPVQIKNIDFKQFIVAACLFACIALAACSQGKKILRSGNGIAVVPVDSAWANNSINTAVFRKNSLVSFGDTQYIAFYNNAGFVVLGKRKIDDDKWILKQTAYKGNVFDAH